MGRVLRRAALICVIGVVILTALPLVWLAGRPPVGSAFMLRSRFADPASGEACSRVEYRWAGWNAIAPSMPRAVVLAEDQRFLEHSGFDFRSIERAVRSRDGGRPVRGASTITQQLAKNLLLWPGRSWLRKGVEAWYTAWMELAWPKRRILELYLNVAQFGPCVFGVEAAAARYFETSALQLSDEQAALLAAVLPNPARLRAHNPGPYVRERTKQVLELMDAKRDAPWLRRL
jgi:monofunctional biosynthetic peptidoglycan transglycosylase